MYEVWLDSMRLWCSKQERCSHDIKRKMHAQDAPKDVVNQLVNQLVDENYLSDLRFLNSYIRTHVEYKRWGPRKIEQGLRAKGFSANEIQAALSEFESGVFESALVELIDRRKRELITHRERVIRYLLSRGYHVHDILRCIEEAESH